MVVEDILRSIPHSSHLPAKAEKSRRVKLNYIAASPPSSTARYTMAEPPTKRQRRPDSAAMWEQTDRERPTRGAPPNSSDRRHRDRSRDRYNDNRRRDDRGHNDRGRDGGRDSRRSRSPPRGKQRGKRRSRSVPRALLKEPTDKQPDRSRSPQRERGGRRHRSRDGNRARSPPRGPRDRGDRSPERYHKPAGGSSRVASSSIPNGPASSRAPPTGPRSQQAKQFGKAPVKTEHTNGIKIEEATNGAMDIEDDSEEAQMMRIMGFNTFKSTKNTKVPGNSRNHGVRIEKKTEYRQYMNRQGGFNRPLSPS